MVSALALANVPAELYRIAPRAGMIIPALRQIGGMIGFQLPPIDASDLPRSPEHLKAIIASHLFERSAEELAGVLNTAAYTCELWLDEYANSLASSIAAPQTSEVPPSAAPIAAPITVPLSQITSYGDVPASDSSEADTLPPQEIASDGSRSHDDAPPAY
jgi:hypothetical protein